MVTFRISYLVQRADRQDEVVRTTFEWPDDIMVDALGEWSRVNGPRLVFACTIADHPRMHTKRRCESVLGGGRCILLDGHQKAHEFS